MHPLVLELTGKRTPQTGLEGKFSVYFAAAVAIAAGAAGVKQFTDEWVRQPAVVALRDRVTATVDPVDRRGAGAGGDHPEGRPARSRSSSNTPSAASSGR